MLTYKLVLLKVIYQPFYFWSHPHMVIKDFFLVFLSYIKTVTHNESFNSVNSSSMHTK